MEIQWKWLWRTNSETLNMHPQRIISLFRLVTKTILPAGSSNSSDSWDFIAYNMDGATRSLKQNTGIGFVRSGNTQIDITGIRELQGSSQFITQNDVCEYEFQLNGKTIGTVSTINNGKVWLKMESAMI